MQQIDEWEQRNFNEIKITLSGSMLVSLVIFFDQDFENSKPENEGEK